MTTTEHERPVMIETQVNPELQVDQHPRTPGTPRTHRVARMAPAPSEVPMLALVTWVSRILGAARGARTQGGLDYIDLQMSVLRRK